MVNSNLLSSRRNNFDVSNLNKHLIYSSCFLVIILSSIGAVISQNYRHDFIDRGTVFQVKLGPYESPVAMAQFESLNDLGSINTISLLPSTTNSQEVYIYLGKYVALETASVVLKEVKRRGFDKVNLESNGQAFNSEEKKKFTSAIQIENSVKLDMSSFSTLYPHYELFVLYDSGFFRVLLHIHDPTQRGFKFTQILNDLDGRGFEAFPVSFR